MRLALKLHSGPRRARLGSSLPSRILTSWTLTFAVIASLSSGCLPTNNSGAPATRESANSSAPSTLAKAAVYAGGTKAAKIIFKQSSTTGSFDAPLAGGTIVGAGKGHPALRLFNPDDSLLASGGPTSSTWPKWISSVEIGVSGANNSKALNPDCARFSGPSESSAQCSFSGQPLGGAVIPTACGAPADYFRVSEYDCSAGSAQVGTGGAEDGVFIRVTFDRTNSYIGTGENILAVLEYAASSLNPPAPNPAACMSDEGFSPENCSDQTWKAFLKSSAGAATQPFLLLVPPSFASVNPSSPPNQGSGGSGIGTRQILLPLAADSSLKVFQISRIKSMVVDSAKFQQVCAPHGLPANSAACLGMIFVSLTLYRI